MHDVYAAMGKPIDQSQNASVKDFKESAGAFFNGTKVESKVYQVTRRDFVPDAPKATPAPVPRPAFRDKPPHAARSCQPMRYCGSVPAQR